MCGIFGGVFGKGSSVTAQERLRLARALYLLSETRGRDSTGVAILTDGVLKVEKANARARHWLRRAGKRATHDLGSNAGPVAWVGHTRMVTNGLRTEPENNQPIEKHGVAAVHNGIIANVEALWDGIGHERRQALVDTEVFVELFSGFRNSGDDVEAALQKVYGQIEGSASIALLEQSGPELIVATNTGSLYAWEDLERKCFVFASERFILETALRSAGLASKDTANVRWLGSRSACAVDRESARVRVLAKLPDPVRGDGAPVAGGEKRTYSIADRSELWFDESWLRSLRRCTRCILPETFPFIAFDENGVCNVCRAYRPKQTDRTAEFRKIVESRLTEVDGRNCLVALSGGRDSCFGLHYIVKEFGWKPLTFTYDWGMVTDLARRNISRMCAALGVENILIAADIAKKRVYIRKNLSAWLRKPDLGVIPLLMAGDKMFFRHVNEVKRRTRIPVDIWMTNPLENTSFKTGYCGIAPRWDAPRIDALTAASKIKLLAYYFRRYVANPQYWNSSLWDTLNAYHSYYVEPRNGYYLLFDYLPWNERTIEDVLIGQYGWEVAPDTRMTWRIGDGTASFYNYVYLSFGGFTEVDTFRSNQIREGIISREEALRFCFTENAPRAAGIAWYLETIGMDWKDVIRRVNAFSASARARVIQTQSLLPSPV